MKSPTFEVDFLLATLNPEGVTQTTVSSAAEEEKRAAETMDWDEDFDGNKANDVVVAESPPESPRTKRAKLVFGRCYEPTFHEAMLDLGEELAGNSDSE